MLCSTSIASKASFLNRVIASGAQPSRNFSVAFNVRSKFEAAYDTKMKTLQSQPKKT